MTDRSRQIVASIVIAMLISLAFLPCLTHVFINDWDDAGMLLDNEAVRAINIKNIITIFSMTVAKVYVPLTLLSFMVEHHFFALQPFIYHLDNIMLHALTAIAVFIFSRRIGLSLRAACFSSLVFGLHPMKVESVAWISERKDVLFTLFYMLALNSHLDYIKTQKKKSYFFVLLFGSFSMLAKPMAVSLPLVLLLCDWYCRRKIDQKVIVEKGIHFLYIIPIFWQTLAGVLEISRGIKFNVWETVLIWSWSLVFYLQKYIFPFILLPHYLLPQPVVFWHYSYIMSGWLCLFFIFLLFRLRHHRLFLFSGLYFMVTIFIVLRTYDVLRIGNFSVVADRFMYLPSVGFATLFGSGMDVILKRQAGWKRRGVALVILAFFLSLFIKTTRQCAIWQNEITLWSYTIARSANDPLPYVKRASAYQAKGLYPLAVKDYSAVIAIRPEYYIASELNNVEKEAALTPQKAAVLRTNALLANNPYLFVAYKNRALLYMKMQKYLLALDDFNQALAINARDGTSYYHRSLIFEHLHEPEKALADGLRARSFGLLVGDNYLKALRDTISVK